MILTKWNKTNKVLGPIDMTVSRHPSAWVPSSQWLLRKYCVLFESMVIHCSSSSIPGEYRCQLSRHPRKKSSSANQDVFICVVKKMYRLLEVSPFDTVYFTYPSKCNRQDMDKTKFKLEAWIDWTNVLYRLKILGLLKECWLVLFCHIENAWDGSFLR